MKIKRALEDLGVALMHFIPIICIVGMFMVPIVVLDGLERASRNHQEYSQKKRVKVTELVQTTEKVLDGYCDVNFTDGRFLRVFKPVGGPPYGNRVVCTGEWHERPATRTVTEWVFQ